MKFKFINKTNNKNLILSVVALIEAVLIMVVSTYAWIETTSSLEILGSGKVDNYTYTVANIGSTYSNTVDLSDYFRESGKVHLASASSVNGSDIYFPMVASAKSATSLPYRKSNLNDKNVNYISFSFNIKSVDGSDFYFNKVPTIKIGDTVMANNEVRIAITEGGSTSIYSNKNSSDSVVSAVDGSTSTSTVKAFSSYSNDGNQSLFNIAKGDTQQVTITMWLQDPLKNSDYSGQTVTVEDFELITNATKTQKVRFVDRTTGYNGTTNGWHWITNNGCVMWVYDSTQKKSVKMVLDTTDTTNTTWVAEIPQLFMDNPSDDLYFYRTTSASTTPETNYLNQWKTTLQAANTASSMQYTAYGTADSSSMGYGTWGNVVEIDLYTEDTSVLPLPIPEGDTSSATHVTLISGSINCQMNYNNKGTDNSYLWRAFLPSDSSATVSFSFTNGGKAYSFSNLTRGANTKYVITSDSTGYWGTPVSVIVAVPDAYKDMGTVSVSGGKTGATSVNVTKGTKVTLTATPATGYQLTGWYSDEACTSGKEISSPYTVNSNTNIFAKFEIQKFKVTAHAVSNGSDSDATGGTVKYGSVTASATANTTVDYNGSATFTAAEKTGYTFDGWYDAATGGNKLGTSTSYTVTNVKSARYIYARFTKTTKRLYFTNNYSWGGTINCYAWNSASNKNNGNYPGVAMTYLENNEYNQSVYYIDIDSTFDRVIFNNSSVKTVDITLSTSVNGYYVTGSSSPYSVGTYSR